MAKRLAIQGRRSDKNKPPLVDRSGRQLLADDRQATGVDNIAIPASKDCLMTGLRVDSDYTAIAIMSIRIDQVRVGDDKLAICCQGDSHWPDQIATF